MTSPVFHPGSTRAAIARFSLLANLKAGDALIFMAGLLFTIFLAAACWRTDAADRVTIRSGGRIFGVVPLSRDQTIDVPGPLGISRVNIHNRQARVALDPGMHQYCVRQGWLKRAGETAICLPNQVSIELGGSRKNYDSLNY
jgi:hypothetical protein